MRIRSAALTAVVVCSPVLVPLLVAHPAEAAATCAGLPATITGTSGNDAKLGTPSRDVVSLGGGSDSFNGLGGDDIICGGPGKDRLAGGDGNDRVLGEGGKDYFIDAAGNDRIVGGPGRDYLSYFTSATPIRVSNGTTVDGAGRDVTDVETIEGTQHADTMRGGSGEDDFRGLLGKDLLVGGAGRDVLIAVGGTIRGGADGDAVDVSGTVTAFLGGGVNVATIGRGSPTVVGGPVQDQFKFRSTRSRATVRGGGAADQVIFAGVAQAVTVDVGKGSASWKGGGLTFSGILNVVGTRRGDLLVGSSGVDFLSGLGGADTLRGGDGNDVLDGQGGRDVADGGGGGDICRAETRRGCEA